MFNKEHYHKSYILHCQLEVKNKTLDGDIMKCCNLFEIEKEVLEADMIATKIIKFKVKLESIKRETLRNPHN